MLAVQSLEVRYGGVVRVRGVSFDVDTGEIVALLGANGAGKSSLLRAVSGLIHVHDGRIVRGDVLLDGTSILGLSAPAIVRRGVAQVMEGRRIFAELTVEENLRSGAFTRRDRTGTRATQDHVFEMFPVLGERRRSVAGYLSGGEQQMLAIGRALMAAPRLLLLDEPSLGLAPLIQEQIRDTIVQIAESGTSVLLVEQNAMMALSIAHRAAVLEGGYVVREGLGSELLGDDEIREAYLGAGDRGRRSFKDLKSYRRRRRWSA
ncbi:MAG TPA: ABC transporter ATP-binding protein [Acidimicrobiia bacterium]|nr:ABC transporter ATP-binding protein [Acidimicrobiia bacterium]